MFREWTQHFVEERKSFIIKLKISQVNNYELTNKLIILQTNIFSLLSHVI